MASSSEDYIHPDDLTRMNIKNIYVKQVKVGEVKGLPEAYEHESSPRGAIFIANYRLFNEETEIEERIGSEKDVEHVKELFSQMGYRIVEVIKDKGKDETMKALRKFSEDSILKDVDSIVVVVGSHGCSKTFYTKDGQPVTSKEVYDIFSDTNCPALSKKPKLFVFNHCRLEEKIDPDYPYDSPQQEKSDYTVSNTKVLHSTTNNRTSYRDEEFGSIYIIETIKAFMDNAWKHELGHLNYIVQQELDKYTGIEQQCELEDFAKLEFYFNPKCDKCKDDSANLCSGKHLYLGEQQESKSSLSKDGNLGGQQGTKETYRKDGKSDETPSNRSCRKDGKSDETQPKRSWRKDSQTPSKISLRKVFKSDETPPKEHGSLLLINNLKAGNDMDKLKRLFENLGFFVEEPFSNLECMELKRVMKDFKKKTHGETAFIIFYGDGFGDYIVTSDKYAIHIKELQKEFNDINCPNLKSKPKIFITNLRYYGEDYKSGHTHISKSNYKELKEGFESHMFFLNVEMEGKPHKYGYLLTEALSQILTEKKSPKQLMKIMRSVLTKMDELQGKYTKDYICKLRTIRFPLDYELQGKYTKDYICKLRTIRFPLDFVISPIKAQENQSLLHVEYAAENPGSLAAEKYQGHADSANQSSTSKGMKETSVSSENSKASKKPATSTARDKMTPSAIAGMPHHL